MYAGRVSVCKLKRHGGLLQRPHEAFQQGGRPINNNQDMRTDRLGGLQRGQSLFPARKNLGLYCPQAKRTVHTRQAGVVSIPQSEQQWII
jgi:hypothetical protein